MIAKKKVFPSIKLTIFFLLLILSYIIISYYFQIDLTFDWNDMEAKINRFWTYLYFIFFFFISAFIITPKRYTLIYAFTLLIGGPIWISLYIFQSIEAFTAIRNTLTIPLFTIITPGLVFNFIQIIRKISKKYSKNALFGKYHIHEGFLGIIFMIIVLVVGFFRYSILQQTEDMTQNELRIILALISIILYVFLFSGSFLIFRDWRDVIRFNFIEKTKKSPDFNANSISTIFNLVDPNSIRFFTSPRVILFPLGIFLACIAQVAIIHDLDFLPIETFYLGREPIVLISIICLIISGGLIGVDWYRLFAKCYPELHEEIEVVLDNLSK